MLDHPRADGYGLRCDKLLVVDMDCYKDDFNLGDIPFGLFRWKRCQETPRGGKHYFFHPNPKIRMQTGVTGTTGVDIRTGKGSFVVIYGPPQRPMRLPEQLVEAFANEKPSAPAIETSVQARFDVQEYLDKIDPDCSMDRWVTVLSAIKNVTGNEAVAWRWSSGSGGKEYRVASYNEFKARYDSLDTSNYSKLCSLRYLKRLANGNKSV